MAELIALANVIALWIAVDVFYCIPETWREGFKFMAVLFALLLIPLGILEFEIIHDLVK